MMFKTFGYRSVAQVCTALFVAYLFCGLLGAICGLIFDYKFEEQLGSALGQSVGRTIFFGSILIAHLAALGAYPAAEKGRGPVTNPVGLILVASIPIGCLIGIFIPQLGIAIVALSAIVLCVRKAILSPKLTEHFEEGGSYPDPSTQPIGKGGKDNRWIWGRILIALAIVAIYIAADDVLMAYALTIGLLILAADAWLAKQFDHTTDATTIIISILAPLLSIVASYAILLCSATALIFPIKARDVEARRIEYSDFATAMTTLSTNGEKLERISRLSGQAAAQVESMKERVTFWNRTLNCQIHSSELLISLIDASKRLIQAGANKDLELAIDRDRIYHENNVKCLQLFRGNQFHSELIVQVLTIRAKSLYWPTPSNQRYYCTGSIAGQAICKVFKLTNSE